MKTNKTLRTIFSALAIAGIGTAALGATSAAAATGSGSVLPCTANQFTTKLISGQSGMGNRYGAMQITAKQGERCALAGNPDVDLVGAHNVLVANSADADAPAVTISNGSSAYVPLHWTTTANPAEQQTPNAITFTAPAASNPHGDPIDPRVTQDWDLGAVDASDASHTLEVGPVQTNITVPSSQG